MLRLFWALASAIAAFWRVLRALPREAASAVNTLPPDGGAGRSRLLFAMLVILPLAFAAAWLMPQITLVTSPSIDAWALRKAPGQILRGDYVMFEITHPMIGPEPVSITKHASCMPGDTLTMIEVPSLDAPGARTAGPRTAGGTTDAGYFCNGRFLGKSLRLSASGKPLDHWRWSGVIPEGMVYVGSPHARGFDSRYFGLLPLDRLTRMSRIL